MHMSHCTLFSNACRLLAGVRMIGDGAGQAICAAKDWRCPCRPAVLAEGRMLSWCRRRRARLARRDELKSNPEASVPRLQPITHREGSPTLAPGIKVVALPSACVSCCRHPVLALSSLEALRCVHVHSCCSVDKWWCASEICRWTGQPWPRR